jgi:hypothetical protein
MELIKIFENGKRNTCPYKTYGSTFTKEVSFMGNKNYTHIVRAPRKLTIEAGDKFCHRCWWFSGYSESDKSIMCNYNK